MPVHAAHRKAGIAEIFGEHDVELFGEIGGADDGLGLQRVERIDVVHGHAHDRHLVFLLPGLDDLRLPLAAVHHERRRAVRMDQVAALLGQHRHELLVVRHHGLEFVLGAAADVEEQRDEPDAFRQQPADLLGHARAHGRVDHANHAAPTGKRHEGSLSMREGAAQNRIALSALAV